MTTLASTSRVQMAYIKETVFGTTPVAGNMKNLRMTGESLNFDYSKESSKEIRSDRQTGGASTVDATAAGGINFHAQYAEYDGLMEGALQGAWSVFGTNGVGATFTATFTANTITASAATTGSSLFTLLQAGQWFRLTAPTHANDGKLCRVSTVTPPTSTVLTVDTNTPLTAGTTIANCTVATSRLTNGTTQPSFSLEKQLMDVGQYLVYRGMTVNRMSLNFAAAALTDGSFEFMGKDMARDTATHLPGTAVASYSYDVQNSVRGVGQLWEGTAPITSTFIRSMSLSVNNNLRGQKAIANLGNVGIGAGGLQITGSLEVYFADGTIFDKFLNDTYTSLIVSTQDTAGNGYVFTLPRVLLMNGRVVAQGEDQDVMASFDFEAFADDTNATAALRKTIFIDRVGAAIT